MTRDLNPNPANEPAPFPPAPTQLPTQPGLPEKEGEGVDKVAARLAQKGAKVEQDYDKNHGSLISK